MIRFIIALVFLMIIKAIVVSIVKKIRFRIKYSKPLTSSEIEELASKRRMKKINEYYRFSRREIKVDKRFKSSMTLRDSTIK